MIKIVIVTCNRAEYNKLEPIIEKLNGNNNFNLYLIVCGSHLIYDYGNTIENIKYPIYKTVNSLMYGENRKIMAESVGNMLTKMPQILDDISPDCVLIHGDRFDVLSVAISCSLMNICLIHLEGGELTGTIDEHIRHAITKLANYHFVSSKKAKNILLQMGENTNNVFTVGCPLYDKIKNVKKDTKWLHIRDNFVVKENDFIICMYHPVTTNIDKSVKDYSKLLQTLVQLDKQVVLFYPNVDTGCKQLVKIINLMGLKNNDNFVLLKNMPFEQYINLLYYCACIVGNSSSGIREASVFGKPSINIGTRQKNREQDSNVHTFENIDTIDLFTVIESVYGKKYKSSCLYGLEGTNDNIINILNDLDYHNCEKEFVVQ